MSFILNRYFKTLSLLLYVSILAISNLHRVGKIFRRVSSYGSTCETRSIYLIKVIIKIKY